MSERRKGELQAERANDGRALIDWGGQGRSHELFFRSPVNAIFTSSPRLPSPKTPSQTPHFPSFFSGFASCIISSSFVHLSACASLSPHTRAYPRLPGGNPIHLISTFRALAIIHPKPIIFGLDFCLFSMPWALLSFGRAARRGTRCRLR